MNKTVLLAAAAAASLFAGQAFANGDDSSEENPRWFSPTGYGPNDTQAGATRELNTEALQRARTDRASMQSSDDEAADEEDIQGPPAVDDMDAADDDMDAAGDDLDGDAPDMPAPSSSDY
jgi:hypothetical protein